MATSNEVAANRGGLLVYELLEEGKAGCTYHLHHKRDEALSEVTEGKVPFVYVGNYPGAGGGDPADQTLVINKKFLSDRLAAFTQEREDRASWIPSALTVYGGLAGGVLAYAFRDEILKQAFGNASGLCSYLLTVPPDTLLPVLGVVAGAGVTGLATALYQIFFKD